MKRCLEDKILAIWQTRGIFSDLLQPLAYVYGFLAKKNTLKKAAKAWRAPVPVIVVGNIIVGGTGKTPVIIAICQALQNAGWQPGIISRGYGVNLKNQAHLSDQASDSNYLGDEPSLLHQATNAPVAVHPDRCFAAQTLLQAHPEIDILLSDDGLQHIALQRDIEIVVQDQRKIGNGRLIPAGPLREPASKLSQVDYIINNITGSTTQDLNTKQSNANIYMHLQPTIVKELYTGIELNWPAWLAANQTQTFNAIAGIGQPKRFFKMLQKAGLKLNKCLAVADHQTIARKTLNSLDQKKILITAKDAVKCAQPYDKRLLAVYVATVFNQNNWLHDLLFKLNNIKESKK